MKIMIRKNQAGKLVIYIPKKDLESELVAMDGPGEWGGTLRLANGMTLYVEPRDEEPRLPLTCEAKKVGE